MSSLDTYTEVEKERYLDQPIFRHILLFDMPELHESLSTKSNLNLLPDMERLLGTQICRPAYDTST